MSLHGVCFTCGWVQGFENGMIDHMQVVLSDRDGAIESRSGGILSAAELKMWIFVCNSIGREYYGVREVPGALPIGAS